MAFQQGLSGLNVSSKALDVISNNISNASTVGFKGASAQFADMYAASLGIGGSSQVGIGAASPAVMQQFSQGNISNSTNPLDVAINGAGFFRLQKSATDQTISYTRNGQYHLDDQGYIVNASGNNLTGYEITNGITNRATMVPVQLDTSGVAPQATGMATVSPGVFVQINLDDRDLKSLSSSSPNTLAAWTANTAFPPNNLNTFNYSTSITVYDQKGNDHALSMYFTRVADSANTGPARNLWETHYVMDGVDITSAVSPFSSGQTGAPTLEFDSTGQVVTSSFTSAGYRSQSLTAPAAAGTLTLTDTPTSSSLKLVSSTGTVYSSPTNFTLAGNTITNVNIPSGTTLTATYQTNSGGTQAVDYQFNIDVTALGALPSSPFAGLFSNNIPIDFSNSTLYGAGYDVNKLVQDGYPYGRLSSVTVSQEGILRGSYSNGQTKDIAQLVLVDFIAPTGLQNIGGNQFVETAASGQPLVGDPGTGSRGVLQASAVEEANIDLTQELVNMITQQRNYQANAQSIKTMDQVMQTLVNLR